MNIRRLLYNDYKEFLGLISQFRETNFSKQEYIDTLDKLNSRDIEIWVLEIDNILVASATLIVETKFIYNICK